MATLNGNDGANILTSGNGNDTLNGLGGDDSLFGNGGNDILDGGTGDDLLIGGRGDDIYRFGLGYGHDEIDNSGGKANDLDSIRLTDLNAADIRLDRVGDDLVLTVLASGESLTVSQYFIDTDHQIDRIQFADGSRWHSSDILANLYYPAVTPTAGDDTLNGNPTDDTLEGLGGNDTLYGNGGNGGNGGNDSLDGGSGADRMEGGLGDDSYFVDDVGDLVVEAANAGDDTVLASISYSLTDNVEHLTLLGSADLDGTGNCLANTLTGNAGNNLLDGGGGNDSMAGGAGDDVYVVAQSGDSVSEAAGEGTDSVRAAISYALGDNLENLELTGSNNSAGTGNALTNRLTGNSGNNTLDGAGGDDWLSGRVGNDTYVYGIDYGHDVIDNSGGAAADVDTLQLIGLNSADVRFVRSGNDLLMEVLATSQTLRVQDFYLDADHEIDRVRFADNSFWNNATLKAVVASTPNVAPTYTDDSLSIQEDSAVVLQVSDFGDYSDLEQSPLAAVSILTLGMIEGAGWLTHPP